MSSPAVVQVIAFFCLLCSRLTVSPPGTKFTKEPPGTVFASLSSNAIFSWEFSFGTTQDWRNFEKIVWGKTDADQIENKYITIPRSGITAVNPALSDSFQSRLNWTGNISQNGCQMQFILKNVTKLDETRTYGCTAVVLGQDYRSGPIKLAVVIPPTIIRRSNETIDVEEGVNVTLHCDAIGDPTPSVLWIKDGKTPQNGTFTSTLQIPKIELRDAGTYVCTAANRAGFVSYSVQVRVIRYKPYVNKTATTDPLIKSWINHTTTLKCAVNANPSANFTWLKHGRPIIAGINFTHGMSTLTLIPKAMGDFGSYSCKAGNNKGTMVYNITVERLYLPGPPVVNKFTSDVLSVNVSWKAPRDDSDGGIFDYKITLLKSNSRMIQQHDGIKQTFFNFQNLKQNRSYIVLLQARNIVGYGESSNGTVRTLAADPPDPPDIKAKSGVLALNITWHSSIEDSKIEILDYTIKVIDGITHRQENQYTGIRSASLLIENLRRNRTYIVLIKARNEAGYGPFANISVVTLLPGPPDGPSISNISVAGKHCSLHWRTPYDGESPIKIYTVYLWVLTAAADGSPYKEYFSSWNTTEISSTLDLHWDRNYSVVISAWNKYGESLGLSVVERQFRIGKEPQGPPDAPSISNISVAGKHCSLPWRTPYDGESPIKIYTVYLWVLTAAADGSLYKEYFNSWNTTEISYALDLHWDRKYSVVISAWNKYGESLGLSLVERQFSIGKEPQERSTTTEPKAVVTLPDSTYFPTEGLSSSTVATTLTELPFITQELKGSSAKSESRKESFAYLLPLWIILLVLAVPITIFLSWKATRKMTRCRGQGGPGRRKVADFDRDREEGNAFSLTKMEKLKERRISKHYETLTEVLEVHDNDGRCMEEEKIIDIEEPVKDHHYVPGSVMTYDQINDEPLSPGSKQDWIDLTKDDGTETLRELPNAT
ncbi:neural cell adhesion molecule 1-like isoform X2 [Stylophora pistillata]|uniref:neural cell adhesion molecule 1-like isoform X2 n=1 Tax=Stylophora pistillata TaxID=50429 RepID=UPI000C050EB2|nr:neural cell adhesion molecule 1-like isoform X2 [Stylophora pistillata]